MINNDNDNDHDNVNNNDNNTNEKGSVMWSFAVFIANMNKMLKKQSSCRWYETL